MAEMATGIGCPDCKEKMSISAMLFAQQFGASQGYYCRNGHKFEDMGDLMARNPDKLPVPIKKTVQEGHEKVEMEIPGSLKHDLLQKFGTPQQLSATLGAVLAALASPKCFIMSEEDIDNLEKLTGAKIKNAREVVGVVFAKNKEMERIAQGVAAAGENGNGAKPVGLPEGTIAVDLRSHMAKIVALAKFRNETVQHVAEGTIRMALDNGWA